MTCTRNRIVTALAADISGYLETAFGATSRCYVSFSECADPPGADWRTIQAEATPAVWIDEVASELVAGHHSDYDRRLYLNLYGVVKWNETNVDTGTIQQALNELEAVLDRVLNESGPLDNIACAIMPDGRSETAVDNEGNAVGVLRYPIVVSFARLGGGEI